MVDWIMGHELVLRTGAFLSVFMVMALWELAAERRQRVVGRPGRWIANLSLVTVNSVFVRLLFPAAAVGGALTTAELGWGVLNVLPLPYWIAVVLSVLVLDLVVYLQHVLFHTVPILWRLHMVHHADLDVDVTSGIRFHTIEILLSLPIKLIAVIALGAPALSALIFEILLNTTAVFNHSNVRLGEPADRWPDTRG